MMNLLYTNQENKEEKKQLSLSKSQLSQQSPPYMHTKAVTKLEGPKLVKGAERRIESFFTANDIKAV